MISNITMGLKEDGRQLAFVTRRSFAIVIALVLFFSISFCQTPEAADKIIADARTIAAKENKNIFLIFHASWCGRCHKMDMAMNDPAIKNYFDDNYVVRHLVVLESKNNKNLENPGALNLLKKYSDETSGIPFWLVFDQRGQKVFDSREKLPDGKTGENVGCPASEKEVEHFINVLRASSKINEEGLMAIRKRFRKIETGI